MSDFECNHWFAIIGGIVYGVGWWFFIDAVAWGNRHQEDFKFEWALPMVIANFALVLLNSIHWSKLQDGADMMFEGSLWCVRPAFFCAICSLLASVIGAFFVYINNFDNNSGLNVYPAIGNIIGVACVAAGGIIWRIGKAQSEAE